MSRTPDVGCYKASYWSYAAGVVQRSLKNALASNGAVSAVPVNVLADAQKFFRITLEQNTGDSSVDHIVPQAHAMVMAWRWLEPVKRGATKEEFKGYMQKFLSLLERLSHTETITLNSDEQKSAAELVVFYSQLIREAEEDRFKSRHEELDE